MKKLLFAFLLSCASAVSAADVSGSGTESEPWIVGTDAQAWTNSTGALTVSGTGVTYDFRKPEDVPWSAAVVTSVTVSEGLLPGRNLFASLDGMVSVNGLSIARQKAIAAAAGKTEVEPVPPPEGAVIVEDGTAKIAVAVECEEELATDGWTRTDVKRVEYDTEAKKASLVMPAESEKRFYRLETGLPAPEP